jgi:hypothetical protein
MRHTSLRQHLCDSCVTDPHVSAPMVPLSALPSRMLSLIRPFTMIVRRTRCLEACHDRLSLIGHGQGSRPVRC